MYLFLMSRTLETMMINQVSSRRDREMANAVLKQKDSFSSKPETIGLHSNVGQK
jgi:hypothetical protein